MTHDALPALAEFLEDDLTWACSALGLPSTAFSGPDGTDPRVEVIRSLAPMDIEACPGSGKTTLLVAKLAILARRWRPRRFGICVLSHTNVARREIEERLGNTSEGKRLLAYPHYVGTIHGFVNEFLAIPWLRSKRLPVRIIDDEAALRHRWYRLPFKTRVAIEKSYHDHQIMKIVAPDYSLGEIPWGGGTLSPESTTYQAIRMACRESCLEGLFCHNEMFVWARDLLDQVPTVVTALRQRFPLLFVDEVQDTGEEQSALLFRIFMRGMNPVIRQRFGDSNQAIYQYHGQKGAQTDPFPEHSLRTPVPNSYRFGQRIADFANPMGLVPHGLIGLGPQKKYATDLSDQHAILLFEETTVEDVLPCYAKYLSERFSDEELRTGEFTAVGANHRSEKNDKIPRYIPHYWPSYDPDLTHVAPRPRTFLQYLAVGRRLTNGSGETFHVVEKIAEGILSLSSLLNPQADVPSRKRKHQYLRTRLLDEPDSREVYTYLVTELMRRDLELSADLWEKDWVPKILQVATVVARTSTISADAQRFLAHQTAASNGTSHAAGLRQDNVYVYPQSNPRVQIRVGSIHSVKGETHTATLVLETYYKKHNLTTLKPWLLGDRIGQGNEGPENLARLKQHYVAMTRPSHLLCLALRESSMSAEELARLQGRGWRIGRVSSVGMHWI